MTVQRGEIYFVNLNPVQGREQAGQRPVLVLSIDAINRLPLQEKSYSRSCLSRWGLASIASPTISAFQRLAATRS